ncbi:hypothetical protein [Citrobacter youngae]|uniref:hypothetical protein n=1 Tax=Citrobacter youngae TaxID=133448 RepID=UPI001916F9DB|nr:hypothetical protein [Citrobacter youngae]MBK6260613.1 hypothetical protein [Citrobacter youngae]
MTSRDQFESWFQQKYQVTSDTMKVMQIKVEFAWESWQASRAAVEIKLPTENELHQKVCSQCASESLEMVEEAIRSSGIKVKDR